MNDKQYILVGNPKKLKKITCYETPIKEDSYLSLQEAKLLNAFEECKTYLENKYGDIHKWDEIPLFCLSNILFKRLNSQEEGGFIPLYSLYTPDYFSKLKKLFEEMM